MLDSIIPYFGFTQFTPALPEFYWNVYSAEQRIKHICYELCKLAKYDEYIAEQLNLDRETIDKLLEDFQDFIDGGYEQYYEAQIQAWLKAHMEEIISNAIKMVFFGLNQDGYFVAYIPDSWSDITFDTGMVYEDIDYGHLIFTFEDGAATIDYMSRYNSLTERVTLAEAQIMQTEERVTSAEEQITLTDEQMTRVERTLYTDVSEGGE